ncbi:beta-galactosidase GalB [Flectobacillus sp. DC10W]|uniref:Beta-galactosidase GalB n=1 Tax=Flectobacillus longus TaxID=2984207 RepID=A0ABT6YPZ5_9BACT|nr:beta-galactosidase GalB [Flectobacillus longus]MDI9865655.1 beta-galactosidase GalB [Flectobacillus longus]
MYKIISICFCVFSLYAHCFSQNTGRTVFNFNENWKFVHDDIKDAQNPSINDQAWRVLSLPHDWSIEGPFGANHLTTNQGGALPTGIGWYRKTFNLPSATKDKKVYIEFDGIYRNSQVWINGHYLGKRPFGYNAFRYELTPFLLTKNNIIAVKVDNSEQPNTRWYSGSGIYRNVRLVITGTVAIDYHGVFVSTPKVTDNLAEVKVQTTIRNTTNQQSDLAIRQSIVDNTGKILISKQESISLLKDSLQNFTQNLTLQQPQLWTLDRPYLYQVKTEILQKNQVIDTQLSPLGIRTFKFDPATGFYLNGVPTKILGVCQHHDLGALGAAVNVRAMERQLEILKAMGCNGIRMSHNPPASELLDLCDRMGFIVMDEAFDMWKKKKSKKDYGQYFEEWHARDLEAMVKRDRNHPSIFIWSIGNEIREQFDSTGRTYAKELAGIVKKFDTTRPITSALTENEPDKNHIFQSGALDVLGFNYKHEAYTEFPKRFPNHSIIATETASALETRGQYDTPKAAVQLWPKDSKSPLVEGNADWTAPAYDFAAAYWGTTHEESWKAVKNAPHVAGLYVWTGFDYLGEPHPYSYPARSSYFGIIDLAGFPKDVYYMYQSEWTQKPVLHLLPHWNWKAGQTVEVWAYYNQADEVELFVNNKSQGIRKKGKDEFHVSWKVPFEEGVLKIISRKAGKEVLSKEVFTAGKAQKIRLVADRKAISADGLDLSFVTVEITDEKGNIIPDANHLVQFSVEGKGNLVSVDNGYQASLESFKAPYRSAYHGKCLAILQATKEVGKIKLKASAEGLESSEIEIVTK